MKNDIVSGVKQAKKFKKQNLSAKSNLVDGTETTEKPGLD